jgi:hypothetical protein
MVRHYIPMMYNHVDPHEDHVAPHVDHVATYVDHGGHEEDEVMQTLGSRVTPSIVYAQTVKDYEDDKREEEEEKRNCIERIGMTITPILQF